MELAQALILTNALGGFSSLGPVYQGRTPQDSILLELGQWTLDLVCRDRTVEVHLLEDLPPASDTVSGSQPERWAVLSSLNPVRLFVLAPESETRVYPMVVQGDHFETELQYSPQGCYLAVALSAHGEIQCTRPVLVQRSPR